MATDLYICPACGTEVEVGSKRCPGCDPPKPWETSDPADDDRFDYDAFIEDEFGGGRQHRGIGKLWALTALFLLIALALMRFFV